MMENSLCYKTKWMILFLKLPGKLGISGELSTVFWKSWKQCMKMGCACHAKCTGNDS
jgi:hypothetical protein